ncbi:methyltransferase domain-containing protein [Erythrobacter sp. SDW2]|uniref:class I SAM-dependent methyltransferase n=1 Tax=Erythrobacter sp. SDW2 TaxID=2907154 RepID=UPI001F3C4456|nr:methyltransferase domain-containing protein [Erythrobacter sp. SDW2]UIP07077.1 methyltransferase domain-containing protein [Erythrobacter sp. SDW2]
MSAQTAQSVVTAKDRSEADREQDEGRHPAEVLAFSGIERGDVVADFMAGGGYYTALLADLVGPKGTVYAVNPLSFHNPEEWEKRLAADKNIRTMVTDARAMQLAPGSVDSIFAHLVFHDLYFESERFKFPRLDVDFMLANWFAAVKPGGTVTIIDHVGAAGDTREIVNRVHRIDPQTVIRDMTKAGFKLVEQSDVLRRSNDDIGKSVFDEGIRGKTDRFMMKFQKPA